MERNETRRHKITMRIKDIEQIQNRSQIKKRKKGINEMHCARFEDQECGLDRRHERGDMHRKERARWKRGTGYGYRNVQEERKQTQDLNEERKNKTRKL